MAAPPITERHLMHFHRRAPIKESVRVATTANVTIATALTNGATLDGITLATGDRVLVKDQSAASGNGIYIVGATPVRAYDVSTEDPAFGYLAYVREGTTNGGTIWKNTNTSAPTIDTTALTFASFGGANADYLVGTAQPALPGAIVVGATPGGELGGTWASPTIDATHAGSTHADAIAKAIVDAKGDIIAATAADTVARVPVGADGTFLKADSAAATGVAWANIAGVGDASGQFVVGWDGGGAAITAGAQQDVVAPYSGTITGWTLLADRSGSAVVDVWRDTYANFPPTVADTITAAAKPTLSGAMKATGAPTGWTGAVTAGDVLRFNLDSAATVTRLLLVLDYSRP